MKRIHTILGVSVLVVIFSLLFYKQTKQSTAHKPLEQEKVALKYIVTFSIGKSTVNGTLIKSGDILKDKPMIEVPANSQLDIQVSGLQADVRLRIKSETNIQFFTRTRDNVIEFVSFITKGKTIYSIPTKLYKGESVLVFTPYTKNEVRGTTMVVGYRDNMSSYYTSVVEGAVATSLSTATLVNLLDDKLEPVIDSKFEPKMIEEGKEIKISLKDANDILTNPVFKDQQTAYEIPNTLKVEVTVALKIENNADITIKTEAEEILAIDIKGGEDETQIKKAVNTEIDKKNKILLNSLKKFYDKKLGFLKLKKGNKEIEGIILYNPKKDSFYKVITPRGENFFKVEDVESARFE